MFATDGVSGGLDKLCKTIVEGYNGPIELSGLVVFIIMCWKHLLDELVGFEIIKKLCETRTPRVSPGLILKLYLSGSNFELPEKAKKATKRIKNMKAPNFDDI